MRHSTVSVHVIAIPPEPGAAGSVLPMPFHQIGKNVFGLYHSEPLTMLTMTQTITANQLIEPKSIRASMKKGVRTDTESTPDLTPANSARCSFVR